MIFRSSCSQMFFKVGVLKNFAIFPGIHLCWPWQAFFYRTPTVVVSGFSRQQIRFATESGIYYWQPHRVLFRTPFETRVKRQRQPLKLLFKKRCFQKFCKFHRNVTQLKSLFNRAADLQRLQHRCFPVESTKFLRTPNLKPANACF